MTTWYNQIRLPLSAKRLKTTHGIGVANHRVDQFVCIHVEEAKLRIFRACDQHFVACTHFDLVDLLYSEEFLSWLLAVPYVICAWETYIRNFTTWLNIVDLKDVFAIANDKLLVIRHPGRTCWSQEMTHVASLAETTKQELSRIIEWTLRLCLQYMSRRSLPESDRGVRAHGKKITIWVQL